MEQIGTANWFLESSWDAPTAGHLEYLADARELLNRAIAETDRFFAGELAAYREEVRSKGIELLK